MTTIWRTEMKLPPLHQEADMTPEQKAKAMKRYPYKFCKKCKIAIKSTTGYCYDCYNGHTFTASPYGLINANKAFKFVPSEERR